MTLIESRRHVGDLGHWPGLIDNDLPIRGDGYQPWPRADPINLAFEAPLEAVIWAQPQTAET